jgi:hypothetical protein
MSQKFFQLMDYFFMLIIFISGEEDDQQTAIGHIL